MLTLFTAALAAAGIASATATAEAITKLVFEAIPCLLMFAPGDSQATDA
jgi:hypothetical protein